MNIPNKYSYTGQQITCLLCLILSTTAIHAQQRYTLSGYITDVATGEQLNGATVIAPALQKGVIANKYGFYSITLPAKNVQLFCSYIGYQTDTIDIDLRHNQPLNMVLHWSGKLKGVTIQDVSSTEGDNDISSIRMDMQQVEKLPFLLGEKDILKAIQLLPGVAAGHEGMTGIYVRGGSPDENLILLDGVPVYNISHLFGMFSVFTPEAIQSVELIKGGFPARYGGRLSSVLDVRMKEGDMKKYKGSIGIGLLSSKFTVEGPVKKDVSSFIISGRRTYWDLIASPLIAAASSDGEGGHYNFGYHFQDLNAKVNLRVNNKNRLYLSIYTGGDRFHTTYKETEDSQNSLAKDITRAGLGWGNVTAALRWNIQSSPKLFSNLALTYTRFHYLLNSRLSQYRQSQDDTSSSAYLFSYLSNIRDWALHWDADYFTSSAHTLRFGANITLHRFEPGATTLKQQSRNQPSSDQRQGSNPVFPQEYHAYGEDEMTFGKLKINVGLHAAAFHVKDTTFLSLQPRIRGRYLLPAQWSLKFGYALMQQPIHLLTTDGAGLPTDLWVPATRKIIPETSVQYTLGIAKSLLPDLEFSIEGYYKKMKHVIAYKDGANFSNTSSDWEGKVETGRGKAYGAEFFLQRKTGRLNGWLAYTLSWNERQFKALNEGQWFPYKFDHLHDLKLVLIYTLNDHIDISANWVFSTGSPLTLPIAAYPPADHQIDYSFPFALFNVTDNRSVSYIPARNNIRMRSTSRLDAGVSFKKKKRRGTRIWMVSVYNIYNRQNPFFYYIKNNKDGTTQLQQFSLLPIVPSISYTFNFL